VARQLEYDGEVEVKDVPELGRFEIHIDGARAGLADYVVRDGVMAITHTETTPQLQGRGIAARLIRDVLDEARGRGLSVRPDCWYVAQYISRHPEYADLLA
jgi:predicted GNAT family acetyltransferase